MRRTDIFFFSVMALAIVMVIGIVFFNFYQPWFNYWWIVLLPVAIAKMFFRKSKFVKWLETDISKSKDDNCCK